MPDKQFDEQFTDFAWEKMKQLLDEEMPATVEQDQKKRRKPFWLWFFLIGFLISGSALGYYTYQTFQLEEKTENAVLPVADSTPSINIQSTSTEDVPCEETSVVFAKAETEKKVETKKPKQKSPNLSNNTIVSNLAKEKTNSQMVNKLPSQ